MSCFESSVGTLRVGLTGGIATGKSLVGELMAAAGIPVIRADDVGHEVLERDQVVRQALVGRFGDGILDERGCPDRVALGERVFRNPAERAFLEELLHPVIQAECMRRADAYETEGADIVVVEAALLVEAGWLDVFDRIVVVTCPEDVQLARVMARDGLDEEAAARRIQAQLPLDDKAGMADLLVHNDDSIEVLATRVESLLSSLRKDRSP